ncbi:MULTISPECIES: 6-phospho-3-hexuloisomerase [Microbacterium]|uniref:6-phospho-3-hexuloisomerase n=1 Tax=Microbacterium TaxID=33882 RepID=UPI002780CD33|nr:MULTISPECIES: 6-phospho-3-hexuloisomerase [Microbacterium]MDQ1083172.1 6-phospho-3-hexuloisomerase [Microbacterium sp. SORGH_AS_0344]MDQ1171552.1 6-phospho-3-hexuloisomerase [Microbacterium proteolyticum]
MPSSDAATVERSLSRIAAEVASVVDRLVAEPGDLDRVLDVLTGADRVFVLGAGRSGLALRMTAMRLMHLGLDVHVVGDTTTPAIRAGDALLTASGSGTTTGIVRAAETATNVGAKIAAITTASDSPLGRAADALVVVPAAAKLDRSGAASAQYAGSLFEQAVVLVGDAIFDALWQRSGLDADDLWPRHANLE